MPKQAPVTLPCPPWSHLTNEWLTHSMKDLNLYTRLWESRSRVQQSDTPTLAEKPNKQIRLDVEGDLSDDPMLPPGLTIFLVEGLAEEWDDAAGPVSEESFQPSPSEGPQCHPTHAEGARPKALAHPSANQSQSQSQLDHRDQILSSNPVGGSRQK